MGIALPSSGGAADDSPGPSEAYYLNRTISAEYTPIDLMPDRNHELETVRRRQAKWGRVDFGDPVVLHDSSKRRLVLIPFFIPHSDHS
jgi:hypothetical protein